MPTTATRRDSDDRLDLTGIDFDAFVDRPLDADTLRCLRYMHDVEHHTVCYLRDVLVTDSHLDVEITDFLALWVYQELHHGRSIGRVLESHGEPANMTRVDATRRALPRRDRLLPVGMVIGNAVTRHLPAVHMTWGAVNEWTTQAAYGRLVDRSGHPVLRDLLRRIMRQEGAHIAFYADQARRRLDASRAARRLTRLTMARLWSPVGSGLMPRSEVRHVASHLFGGVDGREVAARIDRRVQGLPGLEGLTPLRDAFDRYAA
jgi:hypothetical protein